MCKCGVFRAKPIRCRGSAARRLEARRTKTRGATSRGQYSENKKKCKKKWEKHGCQWAKSPPGEADRCTDYKKMYQACLEIPVREAELPEVGR